MELGLGIFGEHLCRLCPYHRHIVKAVLACLTRPMAMFASLYPVRHCSIPRAVCLIVACLHAFTSQIVVSAFTQMPMHLSMDTSYEYSKRVARNVPSHEILA